jgi:hypothetical protein
MASTSWLELIGGGGSGLVYRAMQLDSRQQRCPQGHCI